MNREGRYTIQAWRKSRLAARILLRKLDGRLKERDLRWAEVLRDDPEVTNRLIEQGLYHLRAGHRIHEFDQLIRARGC